MKVHVDFIAETEPDFVSRFIMKFTKRAFSHVLMRFVGKNGIEEVFHAVGKGVCVEPADEYMKTHIRVASFEVELFCSQQNFYGFVEGAAGKEYSQLQLLAIAAGFGWIKNGSEKMICSELVGDILARYSHININGSQDHWTPGYIHDQIKSQIGRLP